MAVRNWLAGAIGLGVLVIAVVTDNSIVDHRDLALRTVIDSSVAIIGTLVGVLVYGRYRRSGDLSDMAIAVAVVLLAWVHTLFGTVPDLISPDSVGNGVSERVEVWGTLVVRVMAAGFLIAAARSRRRDDRTGPWTPGSGRMLLASAAAGSAAVVLLVAVVPITRTGLLTRVSWPQSSSSALQLVGGLLFFAAFLLLARRAEAESDPFLGWIAIGCIFALFAMFSYGLVPRRRRELAARRRRAPIRRGVRLGRRCHRRDRELLEFGGRPLQPPGSSPGGGRWTSTTDSPRSSPS